METIHLGDVPIATWRKGYEPGTLRVDISADHRGIILDVTSSDNSVHVRITRKQAKKLRRALKRAEESSERY